MKVKASQVIGLSVLTVKEGKEVDTVQDVIYDPKANKVKALLVDEGGWFSDAKVIRMEDVKSIGKDDVVIRSATVIRKAKDVGKKVAYIAKNDTYLTKTIVITEEGTKLGHVTDVYFDSTTGAVDEIEVSQGTLGSLASGKKRFRVSDIVTIGEDATIVKRYTEEKLQEQGQQQGLQGALQHLQESSQEFFEKAQEKTQSAAKDFQKKSDEWSQQVTQKFHEIQESPETKKQLEEVKQKTGQIEEVAGQKVHQMSGMLGGKSQRKQQKKSRETKKGKE